MPIEGTGAGVLVGDDSDDAGYFAGAGGGACFLDTFHRLAGPGAWGNADTGEPWTPVGTVAGTVDGTWAEIPVEGPGDSGWESTSVCPDSGTMEASFRFGPAESTELGQFFHADFLRGATWPESIVFERWPDGTVQLLLGDVTNVYDLTAQSSYADWEIKAAWTPAGTTAKAWPTGTTEPGWQLTWIGTPATQLVSTYLSSLD